MEQAFKAAQNLYATPGPQYYPGPSVAPFSQPTQNYITAATNYGNNLGLSNAARTRVQNLMNPNFLNSTPGRNVYQNIANGGGMNPATGIATNIANNVPGRGTLRSLQNQGPTAAQGYLQNYANGGMFNNPNLQNVLNTTNANLLDQYQTRTAPGITSNMERGNRYGRGARAAAQAQGERALLSQTGRADANILNQNYMQSQANQLSAANQIQQAIQGQQGIQSGAANAQAQNAIAGAGLLGNIGNQNVQNLLAGATGLGTNYNNTSLNQVRGILASGDVNTMPTRQLQALQGVGTMTDQYNQSVLNNLINQYSYNQTLPYQNLATFQNAINGRFGGTRTSTAPYFNQPIASSILGLGLGLGRLATPGAAGISAFGNIFGSSDRRLKENIVPIGIEKGVPIYRFNYKNSKTRYSGVMADEVIRVRPDAVLEGTDGFLRVNYTALGIEMKQLDPVGY